MICLILNVVALLFICLFIFLLLCCLSLVSEGGIEVIDFTKVKPLRTVTVLTFVRQSGCYFYISFLSIEILR